MSRKSVLERRSIDYIPEAERHGKLCSVTYDNFAGSPDPPLVVTVTEVDLPRQRIALQLHKGEKWKNVATGSVNAKGRGRLTADVPDAKGKYEYRVVAVGTTAVSRGWGVVADRRASRFPKAHRHRG